MTNLFGDFIGYAILYPLVGLLVMMGGWTVGETVKKVSTNSVWGALSYYGHLFALGFVANAIAWGVYGQG